MSAVDLSVFDRLYQVELDRIAEDFRRRNPPLFQIPRLPWPRWRASHRSPRFGLASWSVAPGVGGHYVVWDIPNDARPGEPPDELMARHLADAYRPDGVP